MAQSTGRSDGPTSEMHLAQVNRRAYLWTAMVAAAVLLGFGLLDLGSEPQASLRSLPDCVYTAHGDVAACNAPATDIRSGDPLP